MEQTKVCTGCKATLSFAMFTKHSRNIDGLQYTCKTCHSVLARKYRAANYESVRAKEQIREKARIYIKKDRILSMSYENIIRRQKYSATPEELAKERADKKAKTIAKALEKKRIRHEQSVEAKALKAKQTLAYNLLPETVAKRKARRKEYFKEYWANPVNKATYLLRLKKALNNPDRRKAIYAYNNSRWKKSISDLTDNYVLYLIKKDIGADSLDSVRQVIPKEVIEAKRAIMLTIRKIKEKQNENTSKC